MQCLWWKLGNSGMDHIVFSTLSILLAQELFIFLYEIAWDHLFEVSVANLGRVPKSYFNSIISNSYQFDLNVVRLKGIKQEPLAVTP